MELLNAEKAKLEGEKKELQDDLKATHDSSERTAIRNQITAKDEAITAIRRQITAFAAAPAPLTMDDVNAWLDANPLAVDQPPVPTSALCWKLGDKAFNADLDKWNARTGLNILIGVSGSGKTRSLYEMLAHNFGFYWTCSRAGNGGATIVEQRLGPLLQLAMGDSRRQDVTNLVALLVCAFSILLLRWRRKFPKGNALDWLVFHTTASAVDAPLESIWVFLAARTVDALVAAVVLAAKECVSGDLLLVVDEAQVLAQFGLFSPLSGSKQSNSKKRPLLTPFARSCLAHSFRSVWFAGTSLSLRVAEEVSLLNDAKRVPDCLVHLEMAFEQVAPFRRYLTDMVGVEFSEALGVELHALFRGRARRVAVLADYLVDRQVCEVEDANEFRQRVMDVALQCESDLLSEAGTVSIVRGFVVRHNANRAVRGERLAECVKVATNAWFAPYSITENVADWFDDGVGKLAATESGAKQSERAVVVFEPLTAKMLLCAALIIDWDGSRGFNPVLRPMLEMAAMKNESARGFVAEVFVIPVISRYIARKLQCTVSVVDFFATPHADLTVGLGALRVFMPESVAGPDAVHTFFHDSVAKFGALGQVKFRASMSQTDWEHALRTVDPAQLYNEKEGREPSAACGRKAKATRLANLAKKREDAIAAMSSRWPAGSCSYIFTICEPPVKVAHEQSRDGRTLFVFSPKTCPELFQSDLPDIDVWGYLKQIKFN